MKTCFRLALLLCLATPLQAQTPPKDVKIHEVGKDGLKIDGKLTQDDPPLVNVPVAELKGAPHQVFHVKLHKGQHYIIDLVSKDFDAFLVLEDAAGKRLAYDDDSGGGLNSRIAFSASSDGVVRLLAAALDKKPGAFQLNMRVGELSEEAKLAAEAVTLDREVDQLYQRGQAAEAVAKMRQALAIRQKLYPVSKYPDGHTELATALNNLGFMLQAMGLAEKALPYYEQGLAMAHKLCPASKYPDGHSYLAVSLNNMGFVLSAMGQPEKALPYYEDGLAMRRRVYPASKFPNGHPDLANGLNNLGVVLQAMGRAEKALPFYEQSLAMRRKLYPESSFPDGHADLARSLNNLGTLLDNMGEADRALHFYEQSLAMRRALYPVLKYPSGHPLLVRSLTNLGNSLRDMGQPDNALIHHEQALAMCRKLYPLAKYPDGHPDLLHALHNLGTLLYVNGQPEKALAYFDQRLDMTRLLYPQSKYPNGHFDLAYSLDRLGGVSKSLNQAEAALSYYKQALGMQRTLYPVSKYPDGHPDLALAFKTLGGFLLKSMGQAEEALQFYEQSHAIYCKLYPASKYPDGHPDLATSLSDLGFTHTATGQSEQALSLYAQSLAMKQKLVDREIRTSSEAQALARIAELRGRTSSYFFSEAVTRPETATSSYSVVWAEKGTVQRLLARRHLAASVQRQQSAEVRQQFARLTELRRETGRLLNQPGRDLAARDKRLVELRDEQELLERDLAKQVPVLDRDKNLAKLQPSDLRALLPTQTVLLDFVRYSHDEKGRYVGERYLAFVLAKDQPIQRIELGDAKEIDRVITAWRTAIQSRKSSAAPGRLQDLVWDKLARHIPAGTKTLFIAPDGDLAQLSWAALPIGPGKVLLEDYSVATVPHGRFLLEQLKYPPKYESAESVLALGDVAYHSKTWNDLPGTAVELKSLALRAPVTLTAADATMARVLAELPKAHYAHFATHGFFDAETLTAEKKREAEALKLRQFGDETRRVAAKNPLAFTGLVLSGGEVMTGLNLVDLPLENLKLVTLSACETGLGEYTGGEGVQGLQRAFHLAGCPNVVASLWKVNDAATAALMTKFYHEMWVLKKPPIEALREAQLTIYRHPELIPILASDRGRPLLDKAARLPETPPTSAKRADTKLWAAFVLSGLGK